MFQMCIVLGLGSATSEDSLYLVITMMLYTLSEVFLHYAIFQVGERIRVILDCDDNTLAFEKNYEFLGVAFRGIV